MALTTDPGAAGRPSVGSRPSGVVPDASRSGGSSGSGGPNGGGRPYDDQPAAEPGSLGVPLRPLGISESLDLSWDLVRRWTRVSLLLGVIVAVVAQLLALPVIALFGSLAFAAPNDELLTVLGALLVLSVGTVVTSFLTYVCTAILSGLLAVVVDDTIFGHRASVARVRERMRGRWPALLGTALIVGAMECVASMIVPSILLIPVGWSLVQPLTAVAAPAAVLERLGPFQAIARATRLSGRDTGRVMVVRGGAGTIGGILGAVLGSIFGTVGLIILVATSSGLSSAFLIVLVTTQIGGLISLALVGPFHAYNAGLLYADRRMRAEGLDVELLLERRRRHRHRAAIGRPT